MTADLVDYLTQLIADGAPRPTLLAVTGDLAKALEPDPVRRPLVALTADLPLPIRLLVAEAFDGAGRAAWLAQQRETARGTSTPERFEGHDEVVERWDDLVDEVRAASGLPPHPGLSLHRVTTMDLQFAPHLRIRHRDGLHALLQDPDVSERHAAAAMVLLDGADDLGVEDVEQWLAPKRRKVLLSAPDRSYGSPGLPAVVGVVKTLLRADDDRVGALIDVVLKDKRVFMGTAQDLVTGLTAPDAAALDDLWQRGMHPPTRHPGRPLEGYLVARAARDGSDPVQAVAAIWDEIAAPHRHVWRSAMYWAARSEAYGTDLMGGYFDGLALADLVAVLGIALTDDFPDDMRAFAAQLSRESRILAQPAAAGPLPSAETLDRVRDAFSTVQELYPPREP